MFVHSFQKACQTPRTLWLTALLLGVIGWGVACSPVDQLAPKKQGLLSSVPSVIEGMLEVDVADDFDSGKHWYIYHIHDIRTGQIVPVTLTPGHTTLSLQGWQQRQTLTSVTPPKALITGVFVRLQLSQRAQTTKALVVRHLQQIAPPNPSSFDLSKIKDNTLLSRLSGLLAPPAPITPGPITPILNTMAPIQRTVLVLITNLKNQAAFTTDKKRIEDLIFVKNNDVYDKATHGLVQFLPDGNGDKKADIFGPFTLTDNNTVNCRANYKKWQSEGRTLAQAAGIDITKYNHIVYIIPNVRSCGFAGVANAGNMYNKGPYNSTIRQEGSTPRVTSHELGHNLGLRHASLDPNNDGKHNSQSSGEEYGDHSCFMGARLANLNAPHLLQLSALARFPKSVVYAKSGKNKYKIYPLYIDPTKAKGPQVLLFPSPALNRMYHLSFKTSLHYDARVNAKYKTGVAIHTHTFTRTNQTLYVNTLADGGTLKEGTDIEIKQIKKDPNDAFVEVEVTLPAPKASCKPVAPVFTTSRTSIDVGLTGTANLNFQIENKNPADCGNTLFAVIPTLPGNYTPSSATSARQQFSLAPGAKRSINVGVKHDGTSRDVTVTLHDAFPGTQQAISRKVRINVDADIPTTPLNLKGTVKSPTSAALTWGASTDKGSGLNGYRIYRQLEKTGSFRTIGISRTNTAYTDRRVPANTKFATYYITAIDKTNNQSKQSNQVTLQFAANATPGAPLNLKGNKGGPDVKLQWNLPADQGSGIKEYAVYHKENNGTFKKLATATATNYTHKSVSKATHSYYVTMTATNNKESKPSNTVVIKGDDTTPPTPPSGLTATLEGTEDARLKWKAATDTGGAGLTGYIISRKLPGGTFKELGRTKDVTYLDKAIPYGTTSYRVTAEDGAGNISKASNEASVNRTPPEAQSEQYNTETNNPDGGTNEPIAPDNASGDTGSTKDADSADNASTPDNSAGTDTTPTDNASGTPDNATTTDKSGTSDQGKGNNNDTEGPKAEGSCGCSAQTNDNAPLPLSMLLLLLCFALPKRRSSSR